MPAVIETHELEIEYVETYDLSIEERPPARQTRPGFWRTLAHGILKHLTPMPYERHAPSCSAHRPFETPMDRFAREYPSLSIYALSLL
jgi:hypothetical protein